MSRYHLSLVYRSTTSTRNISVQVGGIIIESAKVFYLCFDSLKQYVLTTLQLGCTVTVQQGPFQPRCTSKVLVVEYFIERYLAEREDGKRKRLGAPNLVELSFIATISLLCTILSYPLPLALFFDPSTHWALGIRTIASERERCAGPVTKVLSDRDISSAHDCVISDTHVWWTSPFATERVF